VNAYECPLKKEFFVNKRQVVIWVFMLAAYIFLLGMPSEIEAQDSYMFLSKKGARWEFEVTFNSREKSILTIVNEGNSKVDANSTIFSWTFRNDMGVSIRMELFYERSSDGILLSKVNTHHGSSLVLSQRYEPPILVMELPLRMGSWQYRGFKISNKKRELYAVVNTVRKVRVTVPAGTFDAFEIQGQELDGGASTEYWVENVGLVGFKQIGPSGTIMAAKLVRHSHSLSGMLPVGAKVFSHRESWGCASPEFLVEAYKLQAQQATHQLEEILQQKKCVEIHELQGYIVAKRGDSVQINGKFPPEREVVVWVPLWSVAECHRLLCGALY